MKAHKDIRYVMLTAALLGLMALTGCTSRNALQQDINRARQDAFLHWQATRDSAQGSASVIGGDLTRDQAVALAITHNRALQSVIEEKQVAKGRIIEAYQGVLPTLTLDGTYIRQDKDYAVYRGEYLALGQKDNHTASIALTQPLYRGGAASAALRASRCYETLADEQLKAALQQTIFATLKAYEDALLASRQIEVTRVHVERAQAHLSDVETKRRFGAASDFHVLRARVDLTAASTELLRYQNALHTASANLSKTMGVSQESRYTLSDSLVYEPLDAPEEEAIRTAFTHRPDLAIAHLAEKLQEEALKSAYSEYWPSLDAFYAHKYGKPDPYLAVNDDWDDAWQAGLRLSFPLFNGLGREGRIRQHKGALEQRRIAVLEAQEQALFEVKTALMNLKDAQEAVEAQRLSLEQSREGLRLAEVGYREGTLDQVSVLDARAALNQAQLIYYQSLYVHSLARVQLELATGTLTPNP